MHCHSGHDGSLPGLETAKECCHVWSALRWCVAIIGGTHDEAKGCTRTIRPEIRRIIMSRKFRQRYSHWGMSMGR